MLERLREIQKRDGLKDGQMAARLGIARTTWNGIKTGYIPLSANVRLAAAQAFPELLGELVRSVTDPDPDKEVA